MADTLRIKRRTSGSPGAPASLENAELAYNEVDDILYYGKGTGGSGGSATTVEAIGGAVKANVNSPTFTGTPSAPTPTAGDDSTRLATTEFVQDAVTAGSVADGDKGDITVSGSGSVWTINSAAWADAPISDDTQDALDLKIDLSQKGAASGVAELDAGGKVPAAQLPSYVDDVQEYADLASFPATGEAGIIYVALDTNKTYRWSGTTYIELVASPGTTDDVPEGATNLYFTDTRARTAVIAASIVNGDTTHSPSGDAVFDALAAKQDASALGTMAFQNANAVAITGGTIDNIVIDGGTF
jgi:hypothetical protein